MPPACRGGCLFWPLAKDPARLGWLHIQADLAGGDVERLNRHRDASRCSISCPMLRLFSRPLSLFQASFVLQGWKLFFFFKFQNGTVPGNVGCSSRVNVQIKALVVPLLKVNPVTMSSLFEHKAKRIPPTCRRYLPLFI